MKKFRIFIFAFLLLFISHCLLLIVHLFASRFIGKDCPCQWIYQYAGYAGTPKDMKFFDANTGVLGTDSLKIYRTTNGGNNWNIVLQRQTIFEFIKIDSTTIYARSSTSGAYGMILRTFNKGLTWDSFTVGNSWTANGISFVNKDTGWISGTSGGNSFIWRTTNGGVNFNIQYGGIGFGKIFFLNNKINGEYYGWCSNNSSLYRTTDSGINWYQITSPFVGVLNQIAMINENTGWITANGADRTYKTTDGGLTWILQQMPNIPNVYVNYINKICIINSNIIYGIGGARWFGPGKGCGIIWITTNSGLNWGFQQPDTAYITSEYHAIDFIDTLKGWAAAFSGKTVRTVNGGGQILEIRNISTSIPDKYYLYQNYPNPFNQESKIKFDVAQHTPYPLSRGELVSLKVFDILGREVSTIVNEKLNPGTYEVTWDASAFSGGVYFYRLNAGDFSETKKMLMIK